MLKLLGKLLNKDFTSNPEAIDTNVSEDEIWEILHPSDKGRLKLKKKNLKLFMQFITSHLKKSESQRLTRLAVKSLGALDSPFEEGSSYSALMDVENGEEGQRRGQWVFIQIDCKAWDEIDWQVSEILNLYGTKDKWTYIPDENNIGTIYALRNLTAWLRDRKFAHLHIDTGGDSYCSFIVRASDQAVAKELAVAAELIIFEHDLDNSIT